MKTTLIYIFIGLMSIYSTCNKRIDCKQNIYSFEANYQAYPDDDSLMVGDTIWLELRSPVQLNDIMTGEAINFAGAQNLGTTISYIEEIGGNFSDPGAKPAADDFDNILIVGSLGTSLKPDQVREFLFAEQNGMYLFKLGIVPKKKGLFAIAPGNSAGVYRKGNECDKASFDLTFSDTDQHLYLYKESRPGYIPSEYEQKHMYFFKVY